MALVKAGNQELGAFQGNAKVGDLLDVNGEIFEVVKVQQRFLREPVLHVMSTKKVEEVDYDYELPPSSKSIPEGPN